MSQLTLEIPTEILQPLQRLAQAQQKPLDELILEQLKSMVTLSVDPHAPKKRIEQAFFQCGLLNSVSQDETPAPISDAERERLARKLSKAGPLSQLILDEREEHS